MNNNKTDILIIGAGPVGLFAAFYAGMRKLTTTIVDSLPEVGGQPKALYPEKKIFDIPGYPSITGNDLTEQLIEQLKRFKESTTIHLNQEALDIKKIEGGFEVVTDKTSYYTKAVIIAAGNGSFHPRKVDLENLDIYEGRGVDYFLSDVKQYMGKTVAVCGGGDSALDMALGLREYAEKIYLIHRRDRFRAHEHSVELATKADNIEFVTPYVPLAVGGSNHMVQNLQLQKARTDEVKILKVDEIFMAYGFVSSIGPIKDWGLDLQNNMIKVNHFMQSNHEGIYAIGDIATYPSKAKLIATGFGEAPNVINEIVRNIYPEREVKPLHSSNMFEE